MILLVDSKKFEDTFHPDQIGKFGTLKHQELRNSLKQNNSRVASISVRMTCDVQRFSPFKYLSFNFLIDLPLLVYA